MSASPLEFAVSTAILSVCAEETVKTATRYPRVLFDTRSLHYIDDFSYERNINRILRAATWGIHAINRVETIDRFTGSGALGGALVGEIPQDVLDRNTGTIPVRTVSVRNARLSLVWGSDHGGLTFSRILSLSRSESRYALPAGAGILTDPIRIGFDTHALDVETRASWRPWRGRAYGPALMLGAGGAIMWTTTDIKSALLDVRQETTHPEWFISAGVYQPLILLPRVSPHAQIGLMARGVVYDSETTGYSFGIQSSF